MTAPTFVAQAASDAQPRSMRRRNAAVERWLLEHGAGRTFALVATADGRCFLTDVPAGDGALLASGRDLASLASMTP